MRRIGLLAATFAAATFLLGCPLLQKKKKDEPIEDEPVSKAQTTELQGTGAKNEKDILRYAKETKIADEPDTIGKDSIKAKSYPGGGNDVATLAKGTPVTKLAKYFSTAVLVTWDDPSGDGKLMGWVLPDQLSGGAAAATTTSTTVKPVVPVIRADAGATPAKDGGAQATDAGAAPTGKDAGAPAALDAGAPRISGAQLFVPLQPDGKCPAAFAPAPGGCRRPCNATSDCPRTTTCAPLGGKKFCQIQ